MSYRRKNKVGASYAQKYFIVPNTPLGQSFRELLSIDELFQSRRDLIATLKNTARQWFTTVNILNNPFVLPEGRVRYMREMISRPWGRKGPDRMWCEGITIPIRAPRGNYALHSAIELCIAAGNGQLSSTKPTVGLRMKHKGSNRWTPIDWQASPAELFSNLRRYASASYKFSEVESGIIREKPGSFKNGFFADGLGTPNMSVRELTEGRINGDDVQARPTMLGLHPHISHMGDLYAAAAENADQLIKFFSPEDRIDFTKVQLAMGIGFKKTSTPEITASMVALGVRTLCSRCLARYGTEGDYKRINFLKAELDDPTNPWLPGSTKQESYLWIVDYILNTVGTCDDVGIAKQLTDGIGATMLDELSRVVEKDPTPERTLLIVNLRTANAQTAE